VKQLNIKTMENLIIEIGAKFKTQAQTFVITKKSIFGFVMEANNGDRLIKTAFEIKQLIERQQLTIVNN
jgi:hypothetical protein